MFHFMVIPGENMISNDFEFTRLAMINYVLKTVYTQYLKN